MEITLEDEKLACKKVKEFNQKLADDPHNVDLWIDFVNYQVITFFKKIFSYIKLLEN